MSCESELIVNCSVWISPKNTILALVKPEPVTVTAVPPDAQPVAGLMLVTFGRGQYVYRVAAEVADVPVGAVTVMSTVPVPGGANTIN